jgi:hypothetical protein
MTRPGGVIALAIWLLVRNKAAFRHDAEPTVPAAREDAEDAERKTF